MLAVAVVLICGAEGLYLQIARAQAQESEKEVDTAAVRGGKAEKTCRYQIVTLGPKPVALGEGKMTAARFKSEFEEQYVLLGERFHLDGTAVAGVLVATGENAQAVVVPVVTWKTEDGVKTHFMCQASDDGEAPRFSAVADSLEKLAREIKARLEEL